MNMIRKKAICTLLKGIETGDPAAVAVVNPNQYIQHNPQTHEGGVGLAELFERLSKTSPRVNIVRIFSDGDFVFAHTEYEFSSSRVGFEVFRFEGNQTVEHWDNIQSRKGPNPAGHSMVSGDTVVTDLDMTEANRELVQSFVNEVLINHSVEELPSYINFEYYVEHNPQIDGSEAALKSAFAATKSDGSTLIQYEKNHRLLAEGNFVLSVCEGSRNGVHTSFYDLFRVKKGKIVEHWDTTETVPPQDQWKNDNGKF